MDFLINTAHADLPIDPVEVKKIFDSQPKCKAKIQVTSTRTEIDKNDPYGCYGTFFIDGLSSHGRVSIHGMNQSGECNGSDPIFSTLYGKNIPKIGEMSYAIVNSQTQEVIRYGKQEYDNHAEISDCVGKNEYFQSIYLPVICIISVLIFGGILFKKVLGKKDKNNLKK